MAVDKSLVRLVVLEGLKNNPHISRRFLRKRYARLVLLGQGSPCPNSVDPVSLVAPFGIGFTCLKPLVEEELISILCSPSGDFTGVARGRNWRG
jgi:hypothetical protein